MAELRSGDAVFRTGSDGVIRDWNPACERLTGIDTAEAKGRFCWEVIRGRDADGAMVCHPGCSIARQAREGWPVRCTDLRVATPTGQRRFTISTIVLRDEHETTVLHPLRLATPEERAAAAGAERPLHLTPRQREILLLLAEGVRAKQIAERLLLSETTVRNHIRAILRELNVNSQLEAVAIARTLDLEQPAA